MIWLFKRFVFPSSSTQKQLLIDAVTDVNRFENIRSEAMMMNNESKFRFSFLRKNFWKGVE